MPRPRQAARTDDDRVLLEAALRNLYQRKAFREKTGRDDEQYPDGPPPPQPPHGRRPPPPPP